MRAEQISMLPPLSDDEDVEDRRRNKMSFIEVIVAVVFGVIFMRFLSTKAITKMITEKMEDLAKRIKVEGEE